MKHALEKLKMRDMKMWHGKCDTIFYLFAGLKCGTWKCDTVLQGAESARLENARNDEYGKLNYKKYQYIFLNSDVGSSSNAVKAWHPCQIALRRTQQHTGMINTRVLSCWLVSYTGVGTHSNALCELEIETQPRTDMKLFWTWNAKTFIRNSRTARWASRELWSLVFYPDSRPTTCTCLVRPPKLLFIVRRRSSYADKVLALQPCSRAAVQPISFMTLTHMTNSATCNWVNLMQVSSVELSSVRLLWTRLYCRLVMRLKNDVQIKCNWPCQKAVFCR